MEKAADTPDVSTESNLNLTKHTN